MCDSEIDKITDKLLAIKSLIHGRGSPSYFWFIFVLIISSFFFVLIGVGALLIPKTTLVFCPYNGSVCCDSAKDLQLHKNFHAMKITDPGCAALMKSILCAVRLCNLFR